MFCSDGKSDGVLSDALILQFFVVQLGMCGGCGMDDQTLYVSHIGKELEDLQVIDELPGFFLSALDLKGEDGCAAVREVSLIELMVWMIRK